MPDHVGSTQMASSSQLLRDNRQRTIARVESSIQRYFGQKYCIEAFGSTQYGVDGPMSDLDLVIIVRICLMLRL
jgi:DNA polymerase sigma